MGDISLINIVKVGEITGKGRSSNYKDAATGLLTKAVAAGPNSKRWPAGEIRAIVAAPYSGRVRRGDPRPRAAPHEARKAAA